MLLELQAQLLKRNDVVIKMKFKKILACLMAIVMVFTVFSVVVPAYALEQKEAVSAQNEPVVDEETETTEPAEKEETVADPDATVATISLCTAIYVWPISGHTWIYVHNNSDEPIQVGHYEVPVGEGVSVGVFSFSVNDGWGIYYNVEAYKENTKDRMDKVWSISEEIDAEQLETLSEKLLNYPNYWGFGGNCATFAFSLWNPVTGDAYVSLLIPAITQLMIMIGGGKKGVLEMYCPPRDHVYRQKGWGENAHLEIASDYTVS